MNFEGLKKLRGQWVNLWPRPLVIPGGWRAQMPWRVYRVDQKEGVAELHAPSGHFFNAADVIHHFQRQGERLILNAQVMIRGNEIELQPRPWGARRGFRIRRRPLLQAPVIARRTEPDWRPLAWIGIGVLLGQVLGR